MLNKKFLPVVMASVVALTATSTALAGHGMKRKYKHKRYHHAKSCKGGVTLGLNYATYGGNDFAVMLGYVNQRFLGDIGVSYERTNPSASASSHVWELRGDIGLRRAIWRKLYATFGALGSYGFRDPKNTATRTEPYAIGAFVGLDYQPLRHLLLSFKLAPYAYVVDFSKIKHNDVFSDGSIQVSYIF